MIAMSRAAVEDLIAAVPRCDILGCSHAATRIRSVGPFRDDYCDKHALADGRNFIDLPQAPAIRAAIAALRGGA